MKLEEQFATTKLPAPRQEWSDTRVDVLGVGIHPTSMDDALAVLQATIQTGGKGYVTVTGTHGVMEAQQDPEFRRIINQSMLTIPDGRSMVWVGWLQGFHRMRQVTGPDIMLRVCDLSVKKGYTHFLYGGNTGVADSLAASIRARFPGINIVGAFTPPFRDLTEEEENALTARVAKLRPDFFWVGLSTPKQERFMARYSSKLDAKIFMGVGAAFDIHSGRIKDCPYVMKVLGLNWLHRLCQDPKRLWKRYLSNHPRFVLLTALQFLGFRPNPARSRPNVVE
jgi:N-acetylglucosaminyldiphosphoundecaprenol N-acetyl-beta-D-mannosaminyltransferase